MSRVLCVAGHHQPELKFGLDVLNEFRERRKYDKEVLYYAVRNGSPDSCSPKHHNPAVSEIIQQASVSNIDLIIDLHHSDAQDSTEMGLEPGEVKYELCIVDSIHSVADYVWYNDFIENHAEKRLLRLASLVDPRRMPGMTWLGMVAYLGSMRYPGGGAEYMREVSQVAGEVYCVARSFGEHRKKLENPEHLHNLEQRFEEVYNEELRLPRSNDFVWSDFKRRVKTG